MPNFENIRPPATTIVPCGNGARSPFDTDHLMADLKGRSVRGGAVTLGSQGVKFVLRFGSTMVLARLLTPGDFGLVAMVTAIAGFVGMFKDAGLSMATVQQAEITHEQVSNLFWINVALSVLVMLVVAAIAPLVALVYGEPQLVWITLALAGTMVFGGLTAQHLALLRRQMRYKTLATIQIAAMAAGIATAITMALAGFGYWSLVGMTAGMEVATAAMVWIMSPWRPGLPTRRVGTRAMLRFGGGLTGFNILNYFTRNLDNIIVGVVLGAGPLGLYSKAYGLLLMPISQINGPISAVALPTLSRLQNKPETFRRYYLRAIGVIAAVTFPIVAFVLADTENFVRIVLGEQWMAAVPIFRWLAPAALMGGINIAPGWLCTALGNTGRQLRWAMLSAPIMAIAFAISVQFGVIAVAAAFGITWTALFVLFVSMATHKSPVRATDVWMELLPPTAASAAAVGSVLAFAASTSMTAPGFALGAHFAIFSAVYVAVWMLLSDWRPLLATVRSSILRPGEPPR